MASSSAILTVPCVCAPAACANSIHNSTIPPSPWGCAPLCREYKVLALKRLLRFRELIPIARHPNIQGRYENQTHRQRGNQAAYDDNRKWPLRVRTNGVG